MKAMIQYVIAAGKVPIVPTIPALPSAAVRANASALNSCLKTLLENYPAALKGPDLWHLFAAHGQSDGWFMDSLHPSLTVGCQHFRDAWTTMLLSTIYPDIPPDSIRRR
jgi:hypothetical protein